MPQTTYWICPMKSKPRCLPALRQARYGYLLALHVLLLCAPAVRPRRLRLFCFCSRSSVYRIVQTYRAGPRSDG